MNQRTLDKLVGIEGQLNGILLELNGITATGADGPQLEASKENLKAQIVELHGITATGADGPSTMADPPDQQGGGGD